MNNGLLIDEHFAPNHDGWLLHLRRTRNPDTFRPDARPVLIVPGYGMNSFIFSFHPRGTSMERTMADAGYEVWSVNLRQQGDSRPCIKRSPPAPSMRAYAEVDLGAAIAWVVRKTQTTARTVTLIGCSLGGTISYAHMALTPSAQVGGIIAIGSPMRWESIPMLFKVALSSPRLAGMVPVMGSRAALRTLFPVLARVPGMLDIYLNASHVDVHAAGELTRTVEDPDPRVNREIARWLQTRDLIVRGVNVSEAAGKQRVPLLVVTSNRDGIVPTDTAMSAAHLWGSDDIETMQIGDEQEWFAHADLFIANSAPELVFKPLIGWLDRQAAT
jgi:pimeloyl-ACP methyl ester carboxylesterase